MTWYYVSIYNKKPQPKEVEKSTKYYVYMRIPRTEKMYKSKKETDWNAILPSKIEAYEWLVKKFKIKMGATYRQIENLSADIKAYQQHIKCWEKEIQHEMR